MNFLCLNKNTNIQKLSSKTTEELNRLKILKSRRKKKKFMWKEELDKLPLTTHIIKKTKRSRH